jgi:hypothetical protein
LGAFTIHPAREVEISRKGFKIKEMATSRAGVKSVDRRSAQHFERAREEYRFPAAILELSPVGISIS